MDDELILSIKRRVWKAQRNYSENIKAIEAILENERGFVSRVNAKDNVVALCSGGLDSTVMIAYAIGALGATVHPLFIRRGARAEKFEEAAFDFFMDFFKQKYGDKLGHVQKMDLAIPPKEFKGEFKREMVNTVGHPMRNSTLQNMAVNYAMALEGKYGIEVRTIFSGSVFDDNTEPELGLLSLRAQTLNTCIQTGDWKWQITSPFTDPGIYTNQNGLKAMSKADLIRYAKETGIPLEKTRTCFSSDEEADGSCLACVKRLKAFEEAGVKDQIKYRGGK